MAIDEEKIRWASDTEIDPITGLSNKATVPDGLKTSGVKANQPLARQWLNKQFDEIYNVAINLQNQINDIVGGSLIPTLEVVMPVGYVYESISPTPPSTVFGFGTWERKQGVFRVAVDDTDPDFNTAQQTGGSKDHTHEHTITTDGHVLTEAQMPSHTHDISIIRNNNNSGNYVEDADSTGSAFGNSTEPTGGDEAHNHGISGGIQSGSSLPPYFATYIWVRTA